MLPDLKRFAGKQGFYYFSFGTLLLLLQLDVVIIGIIAGPASAGKFVLLWKIPEHGSNTFIKILYTRA